MSAFPLIYMAAAATEMLLDIEQEELMAISYCPSQHSPDDFGFYGCYRCQADEDMLEESPHPDAQVVIDLLREARNAEERLNLAEYNRLLAHLPEDEQREINESGYCETMWCRNCKGRVDQDCELVEKGQRSWCYLPCTPLGDVSDGENLI